MSIKVVAEYLQNATIRVIAYIYDDDGDLVDPTQCLIELWDADETKLRNNIAMATNPSVGVYEHYEYTDTDSPAGYWRGVVWSIDGSGATAKKSYGSFGVKVKV